MKVILSSSAILLVSWATPALAYIDPVTGSVILQALIGGFAAAMVALRSFREKVFGLFRKNKIVEAEQDENK